MSSVDASSLWAAISVASTCLTVTVVQARRRASMVRSRLDLLTSASRFGTRPTEEFRPPRRAVVRSLLARASGFLAGPARRRRAERDLVEWIDGATRIVRSGGSLRHALAAGVSGLPTPPDTFIQMRDDLMGDTSFDEALRRFESANPSPSATLAARCISLAGETGGRPARLLEGVGFTVRERLECGREARALATQARSSAVVIMAAPVVFAVVAAGVDRRVGAFLFGSVGGLGCIAVGLVLELVGCAWMARLVGRGG